jgi:hypothetical protein
MAGVLPSVEMGFCTDGDWVLRVNDETPGKCYWLPQGADGRVCRETPRYPDQTVDVLFTGTHLPAASRRYEFVQQMVRRYGRRFVHVRGGLYGDALGEAYRRARVVVAPDSPVTDRYWSNRVYNVLGRGGYVLHKHSVGLVNQYAGALDTYADFDDLCLKIDAVLGADAYRRARSLEGWETTRVSQTYYHRCAEMIQALRARYPLP